MLTPKLDDQRKCCCLLVMGEKRALKMLIELTQLGLELLSKPTKEIAQKTYAELSSKPPFAPYIEEDLFALNWG